MNIQNRTRQLNTWKLLQQTKAIESIHCTAWKMGTGQDQDKKPPVH
jgi:hypothetical protein